jgi:WG containing repeat
MRRFQRFLLATIIAMAIGCVSNFFQHNTSTAGDSVRSMTTAPDAMLHPTDNGYIDRTGKIILRLPPNSFLPRYFSEGLAAVGMLSRNNPQELGVGYIDPKGKVVIPPRSIDTKELQGAEDFSEGLAAFGVDVGEKTLYGYLDKTGQVVIPAQFASPGQFVDGIALVETYQNLQKDESMRYVFINKQGKILFENPKTFTAQDYSVFSEGFAPVMVSEKWGFIDRQGQLVIPPLFGGVHRDTKFSSGLVPIQSTECNTYDKYGYLDTTGKFQIPPQFTNARPFSEGLAAVKVGDGTEGLWGYIDRTGKFAIRPQFTDSLSGAGEFHEGLAPVSIRDPSTPPDSIGNGITGYIDRTGKFVIPPQFNQGGSPFHGGLAYVHVAFLKTAPSSTNSDYPYQGGKTGYIDRQGQFVWSKTYR